VRIEPESACPLYRQVYDRLRQAILEEKLAAGSCLPSTRELARALGVSRNTVLNAYDALVADGLLVARKGSGTRVSAASNTIHSLATPMGRPFNLWAAFREAHFPAASASLSDPDGNPIYIHR
jgi:GntR family transcriptional regulator/MocR family aminotransferase